MDTELGGVTDVTDVTEIPYNSYTCARAYGEVYGKRVTSVTSVTIGHTQNGGAA